MRDILGKEWRNMTKRLQDPFYRMVHLLDQ